MSEEKYEMIESEQRILGARKMDKPDGPPPEQKTRTEEKKEE